MAAVLYEVCVDHTGSVQMEALVKCGYLLHTSHGLGNPVRARLVEAIEHCLAAGEDDLRLHAVRVVRSAVEHLKPRELEQVIKLFLRQTRQESSLFRRYSDTQLVEAINVAFDQSLGTSCTREEVRAFLTSLEGRVSRLVGEDAASILVSRVGDAAPACVLQ